MTSEPQPFSWPGIADAKSNADDSGHIQPVDPAQAAADAAAAGHQQGFDRGYAEGLSKGEQDANDQVKQQFANLDSVVAQAQAFTDQWQASQVELVQTVAVHLLGEALFANSDRLASLLSQAQQLLPGAMDISLACHPDREEALKSHTRYPLTIDSSLAPSALELRQGQATLELNIETLVSQAFAGIDLNSATVPDEIVSP